MDKAKASIEGFLGSKGKHDVTVDETTAPALMNETVHKSQHVETQNVIDREVHKTHHHTTLQPVKHQEIRPETHEHQAHAVEERQFHHGDRSGLERGLAAEKEKFRDRQHVMPTQVTESAAPTAVGEHVHHHIIETIQPVIQKDTHHHHVVHHTKPVHEVHHHAPQHHEATALPAVTMDQFQSQGGSLTGKSATHDQFTGHHEIEGILGRATGAGTTSTGHHVGSTTGTTGTGVGSGMGMGSTTGGAGPHHSRLENELDPRVDSDGSRGHGVGSTTGTATGTGYGTSMGGAGPHSSRLENKMDPRVDSDGSKGLGAGSNTGTGMTGTRTTGAGYDSTTSGNYQSSTGAAGTGPHHSTMENKLDPRVDSDGSKGYGAGASTNDTSASSGVHHSSGLLNKLDPRVKN